MEWTLLLLRYRYVYWEMASFVLNSFWNRCAVLHHLWILRSTRPPPQMAAIAGSPHFYRRDLLDSALRIVHLRVGEAAHHPRLRHRRVGTVIQGCTMHCRRFLVIPVQWFC
jgi:hypothetical protein